MAAIRKHLVNTLDEYTTGSRWHWGSRDCIGMLFHVVNATTGKDLQRTSYIPDMDYKQSVEWLTKNYPDPLTPYMKLMTDAGLKQQEYKTGAQIAFVHGGEPIKANTGEMYPVDIVPGVIFQTRWGTEYAFLKEGLRAVVVHDKQVGRVIRYGLPGAY